MRATLLPDQKTALNAAEVIDAFRDAYRGLFGENPSDDTLALLVAQSALETGNWRAIHWYNFGNIKASASHAGYYTQFRCNEVIDGKIEWFDPPHPQCNFRAYKSPAAGATDYIRFLAVDTTPNNGRPNRYADAWAAAERGDVRAFVAELKRAGYFTASESLYYDGGNGKGGVLALFRKYLPMVQAISGNTEPAPAPLPELDSDDLPAVLDDLSRRVAELEARDRLRTKAGRQLAKELER